MRGAHTPFPFFERDRGRHIGARHFHSTLCLSHTSNHKMSINMSFCKWQKLFIFPLQSGKLMEITLCRLCRSHFLFMRCYFYIIVLELTQSLDFYLGYNERQKSIIKLRISCNFMRLAHRFLFLKNQYFFKFHFYFYHYWKKMDN